MLAADALAVDDRARRRRRPGRRGTGRARAGSACRASRGVAGEPSRRRVSSRAPEHAEVERRRRAASYGIPSPPPASTSRSRNPAVAASRDRRRDGRLDVGRRAPPRRARSRPRTRASRAARARARRRPPPPPRAGRRRPSRTCRRRRRRRAGRVRGARASVTAARSRTGWRRPSASAIRRQPPQLAHRLDRHDADARLDGGRQLLVPLAGAGDDDPVRRRSPARRAWRSSPPDATSAPRPSAGEVAQDREAAGWP